MNGVSADKAESSKWWDALDAFGNASVDRELEAAMQMARECRHPDAQWLGALFPPGVAVTRECMRTVLQEQGEDSRALFLLWSLGKRNKSLLRRAADAGYAPAQARMCGRDAGADVRFSLAQLAAQTGDRNGLFELGQCYRSGVGCAKDMANANELFRAAAESGFGLAQYVYGRSLGHFDWERFYWLGCAATRGLEQHRFCDEILRLLPLFEKGEHARVLHTVGSVIRTNINVGSRFVFREPYSEDKMVKLQQVVELSDGMLVRARRAVACWSVAGRRLGLAKDIRVMIAKMVWEEPWQWGKVGEKLGRLRTLANRFGKLLAL
jgi:hypothetical protein